MLLQKRIVHKQLKSKTRPVFSRESPVMRSSLNETFGGFPDFCRESPVMTSSLNETFGHSLILAGNSCYNILIS